MPPLTACIIIIIIITYPTLPYLQVSDPPREGVKKAIATMRTAGIKVCYSS